MILVVASVLCVAAAAASGAVFGLLRGQRAVRDVSRALETLDLTRPDAQLDAEAFGAEGALLAGQVNRLIAGRRLADLAAREAEARATSGDGRAELLAVEAAPVLEELRGRLVRVRDRTRDQVTESAVDAVLRGIERLASLMRGVLTDGASARPEVRADLCAAVRAAACSTRGLRSVTVTLDLDERPCAVRAEADVLERMATALIRNAVEAVKASQRKAPRIGIHVRRIPRVRLEEPEVRRDGDPALTIHPRRPNPRLERWLREGNPPAEVVKFIVADAGDGIPQDVDRMFHDPAARGGIGLTMARRAIERAGGTLWVQRAREGGAALHVVLPLAADAASRATPGPGNAVRVSAAN